MLPIIQIEVPTYPLFVTIGLVFAVLFSYFRIDKAGLTFKEYLILLCICAVSTLVGARVLFVVSMIPQMGISAEGIFYYLLNGGIVFYGGLLGMIFGVFIFSGVIHKDFCLVIDTLAPAIPLFHIFGRIGCLLAGCCYGIPWEWGVILQDSSGVIRFPVQIFESFCNALIFAAILLRERKLESIDGNLKVYLVLYAICRFILEFFRGDSIRGIWFVGLSTAQLVSMVIALYYVFMALKRKGSSEVRVDKK